MSFFCEQNSDFVISQSRLFATSSTSNRESKFNTCGAALRQSFAELAWLKTWVGVLLAIATIDAVSANESLRCKYSVRDVAFVNVHGKSWQLDLIKPADASEAQLTQWNRTLKSQLDTSNLGYVWHDADSSEAKTLLSYAKGQTHPVMCLTHSSGTVIPVTNSNPDFHDRISALVHSPLRQQLLKQLPQSLCVFLFIKGADEAENSKAKQAMLSAIEQVDKQLWMLEKASDEGASFVEVNGTDPAEILPLSSIGVDPDQTNALPAIAIMYGQARRLGDIVSGTEITRKKLVALASICGSDCECALDRNWLYGTQMLHDWPVDVERQTEEGLDFDPKSAFVMAEVAQILQKTGVNSAGKEFVELGAGLIIHDLDDRPVDPEPDRPEAARLNQVPPEEPVKPVNTADNLQTRLSAADNPDSSTELPWFLFGGLAVGAIVVMIVRFRNQ